MNQIRVLFEVPAHYVEVDTFVASASAAQRVLNTLNQELFSNQLVLTLVVAAPEQGSLRQVLKVVVKGAKGVGYTWALIWSVVQVLETDLAKEVVKELTGKLPSEIAAETARNLADRMATADSEQENAALDKEAAAKICEDIASVLSEASAGALASPRSKLERLKISDEGRFELTDAQAEMFEKCLEDPLVASVWLEGSEYPPIPINEFAQRAIRPKRPEPDHEEDDEWEVRSEVITVTSPNFDEEDQKGRRWKGRASNGRTVLFTIEDMEFWSKVHRGEISFGEKTQLTVQVATLVADGRPKSSKVVRVLKIDDDQHGQPLDENALSALLGNLGRPKDIDQTSSLFGDDFA